MLNNAHQYVFGVLTAAFFVSIIVLILAIVFQEVSMKARFDQLEHNQRMIVVDVNQYLPAVKQLIDDDKILFLRMDEMKQFCKEHLEVMRPK